MKRTSLIVLVLASMFALACDGDSRGGRNSNGNMNSNGSGHAGSDNKNTSPNSNAVHATQGITAASDPSVITIAVVVAYDSNRVVQVRVTEPIYVWPTHQQKVRWCVYNDLNVTLNSVSISAFNSGGSAGASPCSNVPYLTTGAILPGNVDAACTDLCVAASAPAGTSFQYTVTAKPEGQKEVTGHGPRVIIQ